ncbi:hypothetical protein [Desertihabitans aurantiacus]|uniref:hypothetical protein n=1 Tax=Desertihabitans aurantiacus TaxID=2282477 RepID=UPI000DF7D7F4|nr:hypothetical protein [Desertihabitans aurantiacus]
MSTTTTTGVRPVPSPGPRGRYLLKRATGMEAAGWASIARVLARRPSVPPGATGIRYDASFRGTLVAFLCVSVVEVVAVDLITHDWPWIRFPLLVLGIWGVLFMLGMLLGYVTRPHAVGPAGIRLRNGGEVDLDLPWEVIRSVTPRRRRVPDAPTFCLSGAPEQQTLHHVVEGRTDIEIALERPVTLQLPQGPVTVVRVHLAVDDPRVFADAVRRHIP